MMVVQFPFPTGPSADLSGFVNDGLLAAYLFNEAAGQTLYDASGNGNHMTINAGQWRTYGLESAGGSGASVTLSRPASVSVMAVASAGAMNQYNRLWGWGYYPDDWSLVGLSTPTKQAATAARFAGGVSPAGPVYSYRQGDFWAMGSSFDSTTGNYRQMYNGILRDVETNQSALYGTGNPALFRLFNDPNPTQSLPWVGGAALLFIYNRALTEEEWNQNFDRAVEVLASRGVKVMGNAFRDGFRRSDLGAGWEVKYGTINLVSNSLRINMSSGNEAHVWANTPALSYGSIGATCSPNTGLMWHCQATNNHFLFVNQNDGNVVAYRRTPSGYGVLAFSGAQGKVVRELRVDFNGGQASLFINGNFLSSVIDNTLTAGRVGAYLVHDSGFVGQADNFWATNWT